MDRGAWWARVHGVTKSRTQLKWLSTVHPSTYNIWGFSCSSVVKNPSTNTGDSDLIPGLGRCPGGGNGNPLQYSYLETGGLQSTGLQSWIGLKQVSTYKAKTKWLLLAYQNCSKLSLQLTCTHKGSFCSSIAGLSFLPYHEDAENTHTLVMGVSMGRATLENKWSRKWTH